MFVNGILSSFEIIVMNKPIKKGSGKQNKSQSIGMLSKGLITNNKVLDKMNGILTRTVDLFVRYPFVPTRLRAKAKSNPGDQSKTTFKKSRIWL